MSTEPTMLYERSRLSKANREAAGLTHSEACRLMAICIDLIDLCAKVTGKIDPAVGSIVDYARDEALSAALKN
jgi:thiamine biosynthesis lipoprotein ApbE